MLDLLGRETRLCDRLSRRAMLSIGALSPLGLTLSRLLAAEERGSRQSAVDSALPGSFGRAKRCLLIFMWGGPAHQDTFDLKPHAPDGIRGEFQPITTNVPGIEFCEHFSHFSRHADKLSLIRSVTHGDNKHSTSAHWMLTGRQHRVSAENLGASESDFPHIGSVLSKLAPAASGLPTFVALPEVIGTTAGAITPGQDGGLIGKRHDPFRIDQHPDDPEFNVSSLKLPEWMSPARVRARQDLLATIDAARPALEASREVAAMTAYHQQALDMIVAPAARQAFDLAAEPEAVRDRYGRKTFGQGVLLARRLLEAGVKLVTVYWHRDEPGVDTTWDTHQNNFTQLKDRLIPQVDAPLAAMFEDLEQRGLLDDTLIVWSSEFGRTPKINTKAGRDHWGACNTVWLAGAGIPGGHVHGSSDRQAAFPASDPVRPDDLSATIYHLLGIEPETVFHDQQRRPLRLSDGRVLSRVLGDA